MGLVNTVVPLDELERETVAWCREMLALSPFALRLVKASFNAHEDGYAGIQQLAHDANLLFYVSEEAREGREAFKEKRRPDFSKFPQSGPVRIWLMAARPRTLPAAIAPVLSGPRRRSNGPGELPRVGAFVAALVGSIFIQIGTNLANDYSDAKRGADTADRLGPVRVTSAGPRHAAAGAGRDLARVRRRGRLRHLPATVAGLVILLVGAALDRRRRPLHGRPAPLRLRGPRRGLRLPLLRPRRRQRLLLRPGRAARRAAARALDRGRLPRRRRSSSSTTCATSRPTGARASTRSRCGWAARNAVGLYRLLVARRLRRPADRARRRRAPAVLPLIGLLSLPLAIKPLRAMTQPHRRPVAERRAGRHRRAARRLQPAGLGRAADRGAESLRHAHRLGRGRPLRAAVRASRT